MRRPLATALVAALLIVPATARAGERSDPRPVLDRIPATALRASVTDAGVEVDAPGQRLDDLILGSSDPRDVRTTLDAARAFVEVTQGLSLPDLRPARSGSAVAEPAARHQEDREEAAGALTFPSPAGDLTGDGLDDVLLFEIRLPSERVDLTAVRGTDGRELWSMSLPAADAFAYPVDDVTGDGIADVLVESFDVLTEDEVDNCGREHEGCDYRYDASFTSGISVRSGTDGSQVWRRTYPGEVTYSFSATESEDALTYGFTYSEELESTNLWVLPNPSGDHDGDGSADLVIDALDLSYSSAYDGEGNDILWSESGHDTMRSATRAEVVAGDGGETLFARATDLGPRIASLWPVSNLVGSPAPDLFWEHAMFGDTTFSCTWVLDLDVCEDDWEETPFGLEIEVIDGRTMERGWAVELAGLADGFAFPMASDATGDGVPDVMAFTTEDWLEGPFVTALLSGADGSTAWQRTSESDWDFPLVETDLDGGPGVDLILAAFVGDGFEVAAARLARVDGATGATLFETERTFTPPEDADFSFQSVYLIGGPDADGDAAGDLITGSIVETYDHDEQTDDVTFLDARSEYAIESGREGGSVGGREGDGIFLLEPTDDLDGDARGDGIEWSFEPETWDVTARALRLAPAAALWSRSFSEKDFWNGTLWPEGDRDGRAGIEVLHGLNTKVRGDWTSYVADLAGASGAERWRITG